MRFASASTTATTPAFTWDSLYRLGAGQDTIRQTYLDALAAKGLSRNRG
jgi:DUF971 family protein